MTVITEADVAALHAKHKAEIVAIVSAFGDAHAEHVHREPKLREPRAEAALKKSFRAELLAAVDRHMKAENALSAKIGTDDAPAPVAEHAT